MGSKKFAKLLGSNLPIGRIYPSWPRKLDHNGRRRMFHHLRWSEWEPCRRLGLPAHRLIERALSEWQKVERIEERMITLGVSRLVVRDTQGRKAFVTMITNDPLFEIVLDPKRSTWNWIEDLGHELGHLEARWLGSMRLDSGVIAQISGKGLGDPEVTRFLDQARVEEAFADKFGEAWSPIASHRRQTRRLFLRLLKGD